MKNKLLYLVIVMLVFSCGNPKPRKPIMRTGTVDMSESVAINKKILEQEKEIFKIIIENDTVHTYIDSHFGFWFAYDGEKSTDSIKPTKGDQVKFSYEVKSVEGAVIYSQEELGIKSYIVDQQDFMQGLQEGIKLMKINEKVIFLLPSQKAYAFYGDEKKIGSNMPLIVKLELIEINKN